MSSLVYKILPRGTWIPGEAFRGYGIDNNDKFIHLSAAHQVSGVLERFFVGQDNLCLLGIDSNKVENLKWEQAIDVDESFPHVYGEIGANAVLWVRDITLGENGVHCLPSLE